MGCSVRPPEEYKPAAIMRAFYNRSSPAIGNSGYPTNDHDLAVTTEHESAGMESGATDASLPRDSSVLTYYGQTRRRTDEPSAHPWHQISIDFCITGMHFQAKAGTKKIPQDTELDYCPVPRTTRDSPS